MGKHRTPDELEKHRIYMKEFRLKNHDKALIKEKEYRDKRFSSKEEHEKYKQYLRDYHVKNREKLNKQRIEKYSLYRQNPEYVEKERKRGIEYWHQLRRDAINAYGGMKCACCGETIEMFLTIDHIYNDGAEHRRSIGGKEGNGKGANIYAWLKKNNYPSGFQVLCMNCNHGKARNGGICPHVSTVKEQ